MTEYIVISLVALVASLLTLFSGFGLGTILMPVMAIFFPIDVAITLTAIVHLLNNLFKLAFLGRYASWNAVLQFGAPAFVAAFAGAKVLFWLQKVDPICTYVIGTRVFEVTPVKLAIVALIIFFVVLELRPWFQKLTFPKELMPVGGAISGFLGGISGHQGALRSAFLIKSGLTKEAFIATGVVIACLVDFSRLSVYIPNLTGHLIGRERLILAAALAAFAGVFLGTRLLKKITMEFVQKTVSAMLFVIAVLLAAGLI